VLGAAVWEAPVWEQRPQNRGCTAGGPHTAVSATLPATIWDEPVEML
jgi:hypothetical protein